MTTAIYLLTVGCFVANVKWTNESLPTLFNQGLGGDVTSKLSTTQGPGSYWLPVIALREAGMHAGVVTAFLIYSALSAANTGLYVASRALYGLTRRMYVHSDARFWLRAASAMSKVHKGTGSPWWAVVTSMVLLIWLPLIHLGGGYTRAELQQTLINVGSVSCVLVWSSQCLAYIRFDYYRRLHERELRDDKFRPSSDASRLAFFQPALAWFGLISTLTICLVFNGTSMWNGGELGVKFASAYVSPLIMLALWIFFKTLSYGRPSRWVIGVDLKDPQFFKKKLQKLDLRVRPNNLEKIGNDESIHNASNGPLMAINRASNAYNDRGTRGLLNERGETLEASSDSDDDVPAGNFIPEDDYTPSILSRVSSDQSIPPEQVSHQQANPATEARTTPSPASQEVSARKERRPKTSQIHEGSSATPEVVVTRSDTVKFEP